MADTDETSSAAAREAGQATQAVEREIEALQRILEELTDRDEVRLLDSFKARFAQYRALDADILPLAVENTNIKAQRLSFGPAQDAVNAFRQSIEAGATDHAEEYLLRRGARRKGDSGRARGAGDPGAAHR